MSTDGSQVSTSRGVDTSQVRRRRRWPEAVKRRIVAETREGGGSGSVVARRHDVDANQLFAWCRRYDGGAAGGEGGAGGRGAGVRVAASRGAASGGGEVGLVCCACMV